MMTKGNFVGTVATVIVSWMLLFAYKVEASGELTHAILNKLRCHAHLIFSRSVYLILVDINSHTEWQSVQIQISWLQKPTDLGLHCLQRQGISGFSKKRAKGWVIEMDCLFFFLQANSISRSNAADFLSREDICSLLFSSLEYKLPKVITKIYLYNFDPFNPHFYIVKLVVYRDIHYFLISTKTDCGYLLEPPRRGGTYENPQSVLSRNMKNIRIFIRKLSVFSGEIFNISKWACFRNEVLSSPCVHRP